MPATRREAPTDAGPTNSKAPRHESFEPGVHVIFIATSHHEDIGEEGQWERIPCDPAANSFEAGDVLGGLTAERLQQLEDDLGPGLVSNIGPKEKQKNGPIDLASRIAKRQKSRPKLIQLHGNERLALLHQSVVTMLWAERSRRMTIEYRTLDWVVNLTKKGANSLADYLFEYDQPVTFYIPLLSRDWALHPADVRHLYEALDALHNLRCDISIIPSYDENWNYGHKISDVRALETIAKDESTPESYCYRPETCLGVGVCILADISGPQFIRFGLSKAEDYVHQNTKSEANTLVHSQLGTQGSASMRVIHQQCPPSFSEWGHIRVFIVGDQIIARGFFSRNPQTKKCDMSALRHDCHFDFRTDGLRHANADPKVKERQEAKLEELNKFCKWWHEQLIKRYPDRFGSLDVGCVMRIGLSEASFDGKFFIIGIQRWYAASFFSMDLTVKPYDQICKAFGEQFARVYGRFAADELGK
ncbi:hypothetical protein IL306_012740 [Fusarium sp. DS 682]|nr:hypothetical protein IL306_012740 [Fusarium sp. DS 682]